MRAHLRFAPLPEHLPFYDKGHGRQRGGGGRWKKEEETNLRKRASSKERNERNKASGSNNLRNPPPKCKFHRQTVKERPWSWQTTRRSQELGEQNQVPKINFSRPKTFTQVDNFFSFFFSFLFIHFFFLFTNYFSPFKVSFPEIFLFFSAFSHFYYLSIFFSKVTPKERRISPKYPPHRWKLGTVISGITCFKGVIHRNACLTWKLRAVIPGITCFEGVIQRNSCPMKAARKLSNQAKKFPME